MKYTYDISMLVPGMPFDGDSLETGSLGGSETSAICLGRELQKIGHRVKIFSNCNKPGVFDGVYYYPIDQWSAFVLSTPHDVAIFERTPDMLQVRTCAKLNILHVHDLALGRQADPFRAVMWNADSVFAVSEFMRQQYCKVYGLPKKFVWKTRNGLDLFRFPEIDNEKRHRNRLVYAARPERGLDVLLEIFPKILEREPSVELALFGYHNPVDHMKEFYSQLSQRTSSFGDKVRFVGELSKSALYQQYVEAGIYAYPTPSPLMKDFNEVSCISCLEAQAAGMPIVTSKRGALVETVDPGAGILLEGDPSSEEYQEKFVDAIISYMHDDKLYDAASEAGQRKARKLGWDGVAKDWTKKFDRMIEELNDDPVRLAHHFYWRSDIFAAKKALKGQTSPSAKRLRHKISEEYAFIKSRDIFEEHYRKGGENTDTRLSGIPVEEHDFKTTSEKRFHILVKYLTDHPELENILEFGCGHGWSSIYLHNQLGRKWTGVDIDPGAIKWARIFTKEHANHPEDLEFVQGSHDVDLGDRVPFDCVILSEVLEHCIDPYKTIEAVEKMVKPGGIVIVTVPYGPSEYGTSNWEKFRNHLWEFDVHDLQDMFGKKHEMNLFAVSMFPNSKTGDMLGFHIINYRADQEPVGRIDWDRKLWLQRPRLTTSASIIAGPNCEDTLLWCLNSIKWIVDEIVLADTGLSPLARSMAESVGVRFVENASNPTVVGFEVPRNESLDKCSMDLVLWIDTDEKLLGGEFLTKYYRKCIWDGWSIRQHHFTVDTSWKPDLPVRLFTRGPVKGKEIRYIGKIHEHPERGLNKGPGDVLILPDVHIAHVGYLNEVTRRARFLRNTPLLELDKKAYPDRLLQKHFIMRDNMLMNMYEHQLNGGRITDSMRKRAEEVIDLYRNNFLGKKKYAFVDGLEYYTEALRQLGQGIDVAFNLAAGRDGVGDDVMNGTPFSGGPVVARFADVNEASAELVYRMREKMNPLTKEGW